MQTLGLSAWGEIVFKCSVCFVQAAKEWCAATEHLGKLLILMYVLE